MSKSVEAANEITAEQHDQVEMDSKYRLIVVAAQRSKQLQRGAHPRAEVDAQKHKPTRIAIEEVQRGKVNFDIITVK